MASLDVEVKLKNVDAIGKQMRKVSETSFMQGLSSAAKSSELGKVLKQLGKTLNQNVGDATKGVGKTIMNLVVTPMKVGMLALVNAAMNPIQTIGKAISGLGAMIKGIGDKLIPASIRDWIKLGIAWKIVEKISDSVGKLMDFMQDMSKQAAISAATSGKSAAQLRSQWTAMAIEMKGRNPTATLKEFGDAFQSFAAEGVDMSDAVAKKSVESMVKFSQMTGGAADSLTPLVAQLIKTGKAGPDLDKTMGVLLSGFRSGAAAAKGLALAQKMAMEGADFDKSAKGLAAMNAALTSVGLTGEQSQGILEGLASIDITQLSGPLQTQVEALQRGDFSGAADIFAEIQNMAKSGGLSQLGSLAEGLGIQGFNQQTLAALASAKDLGPAFSKSLDQVAGSKGLSAIQGEALKDPKSRWEAFLGTMETRFYSLALKVMPAVEGAITMFSKLGSGLMKVFEPFFDALFNTGEKKKGESVFQSIGNSLAAFGTTVQTFLGDPQVINIFKWLGTTIRETIGSIFDAFKSDPGKEKPMTETIKEALISFGTWLKEIDWKEVVSTVKNIFKALKDGFDWFMAHPFITSMLVGGLLLEKFVGIKNIFGVLSSFFSKDGPGMGEVMMSVGKALPTFGMGLASFFTALGGALTTGVGALGMAAALGAVILLIYSLVGAIKWGGEDLQNFVKALGDAIATIVEGIGKAISGIIQTVIGGIAVLVEVAVGALERFEKTKIGGAIAKLIVSGIDNVTKFIQMFGQVLDLALKGGQLMTAGVGWVIDKVIGKFFPTGAKEEKEPQPTATATGMPSGMLTAGVVQTRKATTAQELLLKDIATILSVMQGISYKQLEAQMGAAQAQKIIALQTEASGMKK